MGPDGEATGDDTHENRADGEEDDDGERGEDAVDCAVVDGVLEVDAKEAGETIAVSAAGGAAIAVATTATKRTVAAKGAVVLLEVNGAVGVGSKGGGCCEGGHEGPP